MHELFAWVLPIRTIIALAYDGKVQKRTGEMIWFGLLCHPLQKDCPREELGDHCS
jgi:hypothetical protein